MKKLPLLLVAIIVAISSVSCVQDDDLTIADETNQLEEQAIGKDEIESPDDRS